MTSEQQLIDYQRVEKAIEFIALNQVYQPSLEDIAAAVKMSPNHFHRLFTSWAGISPKKFLQYITLEKSRQRLAMGDSLSATAYQSGLSGTGRLHDLYIRFEGMTPGQYREAGRGVELFYDIFPSIFGMFLLGITGDNKITTISFTDNPDDAVDEFRTAWKEATIVKNNSRTAPVAEKIVSPVAGTELTISARGTEFQLKVWEALLKIPFGKVVSYKSIAEASGNPKALQAVGSAIGSNPVAYLIPCHRVIRRAGNISQYRWGQNRKTALIGWEACLAEDKVSTD